MFQGLRRRREALGGAAAALVAGASSTARAETDPLVIDKDAVKVGILDGSRPDGAIVVKHGLNFGNQFAPSLTLWDPTYTIGIQPSTMYFRTDKSFAWYQGGTYKSGELDAGGGTKAMSLSNTQLSVAGSVTAASFSGKGAVPVGAILMWSGEPSRVPTGWALCDGNNGTPDLRDRFIVGYNANNPDYNQVKKTGGEAKHNLSIAEMPAHDHGEAGEHKHVVAWGKGIGDNIGFAWARNQGGTSDPMNPDGRHKHASVGGSQPHENRPPYCVLAYIMYTGQ
jgi:microcystin-dependent protein